MRLHRRTLQAQVPLAQPILLAPTPRALQAQALAAVGTIGQPTAETPTLHTDDWNDDGYNTPVVLAVVRAAVSGANLTATPVVALIGELDVAGDLTISLVQQLSSGERIRLRRIGSGRFDTYFDNENSPMYPNARLFIQTLARRVEFTIANTGGGGNNWDVVDINHALDIIQIETGDYFIVAIAEPTPVAASSQNLAALAHLTAHR